MSNLLLVLSNALVISGLLIFFWTLLLVRKLTFELPEGPLRRKWFFQSVLILIFILGYLGYIVVNWGKQTDLALYAAKQRGRNCVAMFA